MAEIVFRWSGFILLMGSILLGIAVFSVSLKPVMEQPLSQGMSLLLLLSAVLLLVSLPGMYARQANTAGLPGLTGYGLLQIGMLLLVVVATPSLLYPSLQLRLNENLVFFLLGIALTLGLLLTGIATIQADVFPRWAGILLLAATLGFFFDFFVAEFLPSWVGQVGSALFGVILAISLAWIGLSLWMEKLGPAVAN